MNSYLDKIIEQTKSTVEIDKQFVGQKLDNIIEDEDLRRYIL